MTVKPSRTQPPMNVEVTPAEKLIYIQCKYINPDGSCNKLSDSEVREYCVDGPCEYLLQNDNK